MGSYLDILEESLRKKLVVLDEIQVYNEKQYQCFSAEEPDVAGFDAAIEEKGRLIDRINKLDEGFETLYENVQGELQKNKQKYVAQIAGMQELIRQITEKSAAIQAQEQRNKKVIETYFSKEKSRIKEGRVNSQAAYGYYKSLNKAVLEEKRAFDLKQ